MLAATLLAGCTRGGDEPGTGGSPSAAPSSTASKAAPNPYAQRLAWRSCGERVECSTLRVPLDHTQPAGRRIDVAVVRVPATGGGRPLGSLVLNPGGPGGSGVAYARAAPQVLPPDLRARFDIIGFDPRGVGASTPVDCISDRQTDALLAGPGEPENAAELQQVVASSRALVEGCRRSSGDLLSHLRTDDVARDMDVLRAALGDQRLTFLGKSYGTFLGARYAELFPTRVRALALDGAVDPSLTGEQLNAAQARGFESSFTAFLTQCVADGGCPLGSDVPAARAAVQRLLERAERSPLPAEGERKLSESLLAYALAAALYSPAEGWPELEAGLREALDGRGARLLRLADALLERDPSGRYSSQFESNIAINCVDRPWPRDVKRIQRLAAQAACTSPLFGPAIVYGSLPCALWPVPPSPAAPVRAAGAPPILVVGTEADPATPFAWSQALAAQLESGVLLAYDGSGHTAFGRGSRCIDEAVIRYLVETIPPATGTRCR